MPKSTILAAGALALLAAAPTLPAQSKSDFDALKRRVAELEQRLGEQETQVEKSSLNKLKLSDSVTEMRLYGDLRLRYQYDNRDLQVNDAANPSNGDDSSNQRSRWRFRLRLNAEFKLAGNFFGGVQLVTGQGNDTDNQTFENGFSDYDIFISRAYLGWNATDWLTIIAGKQPNPFYTTELVWDTDLNPQGLVETIAFHKLFAPEAPEQGLSKDGKSVVSKAPELPWELTLNLGQFIFDDNFEGNFDNDSADDSYMFVAQLVGSWRFSKDMKLTFAPGYMFFNAADVSGVVNENNFSDGPGVSGETRKLSIITAPGEFSFKLGSIPTKFYWDFAYNTDGKGRVNDIYDLVTTDPRGGEHSKHEVVDDFAYLVGVQLGQNKKAGDWSIYANWRQQGIASLDPNINESDWGLSELNQRGTKVAVTYSFTDYITGSVAYSHSWNLRDNLFGGQATGGAAVADGNSIDVLQVDLSMKF